MHSSKHDISVSPSIMERIKRRYQEHPMVVSFLVSQVAAIILYFGDRQAYYLRKRLAEWTVTVNALSLYTSLFLFYSVFCIYRSGFRAHLHTLRDNAPIFVAMVVLDFEREFWYYKAPSDYQIDSKVMSNAVTIGVTIILSTFALGAHYKWSHYLSITTVLTSTYLLLNVIGVNYVRNGIPPTTIATITAICTAIIRGVVFALREKALCTLSVSETLAGIGTFGVLLTGFHSGVLDRSQYANPAWDAQAIIFLVTFTLITTVGLTAHTYLVKRAGATYALLTATSMSMYLAFPPNPLEHVRRALDVTACLAIAYSGYCLFGYRKYRPSTEEIDGYIVDDSSRHSIPTPPRHMV